MTPSNLSYQRNKGFAPTGGSRLDDDTATEQSRQPNSHQQTDSGNLSSHPDVQGEVTCYSRGESKDLVCGTVNRLCVVPQLRVLVERDRRRDDLQQTVVS
jgi:hypothetical protein